MERKLAAVLYADVAGYSRLTGADEEGTHGILSVFLDAFAEAIRRHAGRVVHYAGDAILAEFASVHKALGCAVAVQRDFTKRNSGLPDQRKLQFRIGVSLGDVIVDRGDIYGNGVNIAARLETLADPGGICVSGTVFNEVEGRLEGKLDLSFVSLGEQRVKNIEKPLLAYKVILDPITVILRQAKDRKSATAGSVTPPETTAPPPPLARPAINRATIKSARPPARSVRWRWVAAGAIVVVAAIGTSLFWRGSDTPPPDTAAASRIAAPTAEKPLVVVLPFANRGDDAEQQYFSDGVTEDVIAALGRTASVEVIGRDTTFLLKEGPRQPVAVGQRLGAGYVVDGSARRIADRVQISVHLWDVTNGRAVWSQDYDRPAEEVPAIETDLVRQVVAATGRPSGIEEAHILGHVTRSSEAYDFLLRGREYLGRRTRFANLQARQFFQQAIAFDPELSAAYTALAWTHFFAIDRGWAEFPGEELDRIEALAQKALRLDPLSAEAYQLLGWADLRQGQFDVAVNELERAVALNPSDPFAHVNYGAVLLYAGRIDEALETLETALRLDPRTTAKPALYLGLAYYLKQQYAEAVDALERSLKEAPNYTNYAALAAAYAQSGRTAEARQAAETVVRLWPFFDADLFVTQYRDPAHRAQLADGLRKAGIR